MRIPIDPLKLMPVFSLVYKGWVRTIRYKFHGDLEGLLDKQAAGEHFVIGLWHDDLFNIIGMAGAFAQRFAALVSQSKDGEIAAQLLESLGHRTIRGSSSRGGLRALLEVKRVMERENVMPAFAMDGPRGPRHKPKDGIILAAQIAGAKIIPLRTCSKSKKIFEKSWDKFIIPYPFTRCDVYVGEPFAVTTNKLNKSELASERERLEEHMKKLGPHK